VHDVSDRAVVLLAVPALVGAFSIIWLAPAEVGFAAAISAAAAWCWWCDGHGAG